MRGMKSAIVKRSVVIARQKTSVSLEDAFWAALKQVARERKMPLSELVTGIDAQRSGGNLSSAIRLFVLEHYREVAARSQATRAADVQTSEQPRIAAS